jgi:hypothetical protein
MPDTSAHDRGTAGRRTPVGLVLAAALAASLAACAGNTSRWRDALAPGVALPVLEQAGADRDDRVTEAELLAWERGIMAEADADDSGVLTLDEIERWSRGNPAIYLDRPRLELLLRRLYPDRADPAGFPLEVALARYHRRRMAADSNGDKVITRAKAIAAARRDKARIDLTRLLDEVAPRADLGAASS